MDGIQQADEKTARPLLRPLYSVIKIARSVNKGMGRAALDSISQIEKQLDRIDQLERDVRALKTALRGVRQNADELIDDLKKRGVML